MARKTLGRMTVEEIDTEISELEASPQKVGGTHARIAKLAGEKARRIEKDLEKHKQALRRLAEFEEGLKNLGR